MGKPRPVEATTARTFQPNGRSAGYPPDESGFDVGEAAEQDAEGDLLGQLAALQSAGRIAIWRITPVWAEGYICTIDPSEPFDLDTFRAEFGGGDYSARSMGRDAKGKFVYRRGSVRFKIVGAPKVEGSHAPHSPARVPLRPDAVIRRDGSQQLNVEGLLDRMLNEMAEMRRELAEAKRAPPMPEPPPALPATAAMGGLGAMLGQLKELKKVQTQLRELISDDHDDDDDDGDDEPAQPKKPAASIEEMLFQKLFEEKPKAPAPTAAPTAGQPRLIRRSEAQPRSAEQPRTAPPPPPPPQPAEHAEHADLGGAEDMPPAAPEARAATAQAVIEHMRTLSPEEGQQLLETLVRQVPKQVLLHYANRDDG